MWDCDAEPRLNACPSHAYAIRRNGGFIGAALCIAIVAIVLGNLTNSYVTLIVAALGMVVLGGLLRQRRGANPGRHATAHQGRLKRKSE